MQSYNVPQGQEMHPHGSTASTKQLSVKADLAIYGQVLGASG